MIRRLSSEPRHELVVFVFGVVLIASFHSCVRVISTSIGASDRRRQRSVGAFKGGRGWRGEHHAAVGWEAEDKDKDKDEDKGTGTRIR